MQHCPCGQTSFCLLPCRYTMVLLWIHVKTKFVAFRDCIWCARMQHLAQCLRTNMKSYCDFSATTYRPSIYTWLNVCSRYTRTCVNSSCKWIWSQWPAILVPCLVAIFASAVLHSILKMKWYWNIVLYTVIITWLKVMILGDTTMFAESLQPLYATVDEAQRIVPMIKKTVCAQSSKTKSKDFLSQIVISMSRWHGQ